MSKSLYLECGSGISGDMTVAALLDLGADREVLEKSLESLKLPGYEIAITRVKKSGLDEIKNKQDTMPSGNTCRDILVYESTGAGSNTRC